MLECRVLRWRGFGCLLSCRFRGRLPLTSLAHSSNGQDEHENEHEWALHERLPTQRAQRHSRRNAKDSSLRALRVPLHIFAFRLTVRHRSIFYFTVLSQTGSGRSTISHLTFGSFSFDSGKGRRIASTKSTAFTSFSQAQRMLVFPVSLPTRFEIV